MPLRLWLHLAEIALALVLASALFISWREGRREHDHLAAALAEAKQALSTADARQHDRDSQLNQTLAGLAALRNQSQTPAQIIKDLPNQIPLPIPFELQPTTGTAGAATASVAPSVDKSSNPRTASQSTPDSPKPAQTQTVIPNQDLKPLYDFALDCKSCQAKLAAAQGDVADERTKTAALGKERDAALKAAKGGSFWHHVTRAGKWFALGAAAGALAAKAAH